MSEPILRERVRYLLEVVVGEGRTLESLTAAILAAVEQNRQRSDSDFLAIAKARDEAESDMASLADCINEIARQANTGEIERPDLGQMRDAMWRVEYARLAVKADRDKAARAGAAYAEDCESLREELEDAKAREAKLREAARRALSDLEWIEKQVPKTNMQASILLLRHALAVKEEK